MPERIVLKTIHDLQYQFAPTKEGFTLTILGSDKRNELCEFVMPDQAVIGILNATITAMQQNNDRNEMIARGSSKTRIG